MLIFAPLGRQICLLVQLGCIVQQSSAIVRRPGSATYSAVNWLLLWPSYFFGGRQSCRTTTCPGAGARGSSIRTGQDRSSDCAEPAQTTELSCLRELIEREIANYENLIGFLLVCLCLCPICPLPAVTCQCCDTTDQSRATNRQINAGNEIILIKRPICATLIVIVIVVLLAIYSRQPTTNSPSLLYRCCQSKRRIVSKYLSSSLSLNDPPINLRLFNRQQQLRQVVVCVIDTARLV